MKYVLILMLHSSNGSNVLEAHNFHTKKACEHAGAMAVEKFDIMLIRTSVYYICAPQAG